MADRVVPGLVLLCAVRGQNAVSRSVRVAPGRPAPAARAPDTVYDVASLTKAVITSVLAMQVGAGRLALDEPVAARSPSLPGRTGGKDKVTVRHLLAHASGLPAHRPFWSWRPAASERWRSRSGGARAARVPDRHARRSTPTWASSCSAGCSSALRAAPRRAGARGSCGRSAWLRRRSSTWPTPRRARGCWPTARSPRPSSARSAAG